MRSMKTTDTTHQLGTDEQIIIWHDQKTEREIHTEYYKVKKELDKYRDRNLAKIKK